MQRSFSRLLLAGGLTATILVAGHNLTGGTATGALGVAAGSIIGGQLGHPGSHPGASQGAPSHASKVGAGGKGSSAAGNPAAPGSNTGTALTGVGTYADVNTGLMMRSPSPPPVSLDQYVNGYIIEAAWNVIEPTQGAFVTTRIDKAVAAVRKWNAANPNNQRGLRLRITAGFNTPAWALNLGGAAMHLCSQSGTCGSVPRWWTAPVEAAYQAFTARLAAYVNPMPEVREVTVGLTMVRFGEVMVRFPTAGGNAAAYAAAGYTEALDIAAMKAEINDGKAFDAVTQVDVADYQTPSNGQDITVSKEVMDYAVTTLAHVQFANASITQSPNQNAAIFSLMQTYGPRGNRTASVTFQTFPTLSSVTETLARAVSYGACSVEMPQSGVTQAIAATYDSELRANCSVMGIPVPNTPSPSGGTVQSHGIALTAAYWRNANWGSELNANWSTGLNANWASELNANWGSGLNANWSTGLNANWSSELNANWGTDL